MRSRLARALKLICEKETRYNLHLSLGAARVEVGRKNSMRKLMDRADQSMYDEKRRKAKGVPRTAKIRGRSRPLFGGQEFLWTRDA